MAKDREEELEIPAAAPTELDGIDLPEELPVLPAKDIVAFPSVIMSLYVGLPKTVRAIEKAVAADKLIFVVAQLDPDLEEPTKKDLYRIGVVCSVLRTLQLPDGRYKVLLQGLLRARAKSYSDDQKFLKAKIEPLPPPEHLKLDAQDEVLMNRVHESLRILVENEHLAEEILVVTQELDEPGILSDMVIAHYRLEIPDAQELLEELDPVERLKRTEALITDDLNQFLISEKVRNQARDEMTKDQREYFLREQIKLLRRELGEADTQSEELDGLREALAKARLPKEAQKEVDKQLQRLERLPQESSEYALVRTYLEWFADLPWSKKTRERVDLKRARKILDQDHFGLEKVKERILEYLSVRKLNKDSHGPILCFVGPPGVGKTSLGRSIAKALNRKFHRISVGGVRDEAEIRGHRRTYVGALPGRVIQGLKQAEANNPVFVLDELDKLGSDFRGDPSSALLEVLDPQQNSEFSDHYLSVPFDLSSVMFIATANTTDSIPEALLDRLEIIRLPGYTTEEKVKIADTYLVPRQIAENGVKGKGVIFGDEALEFLVERYTREAGVRGLEREIGSLCRKIARQFAEDGELRKKVTVDFIREALGPTRFDPDVDEQLDSVGLVRGLAWTAHGGEILHIEASIASGSGQVSLTGRLGEVMQESARAAVFYARANADALGLDRKFHQTNDIHIHAPGGAIPKDGPSAGVAIVTALVSALSGRKVSKDVAMTGEITLRGAVLQIGGLKEKALAALRYGIRKVIIPFENIKDLEEIPKEQRDQIKFIPVRHIGEVLKIALLEPKRKGVGQRKASKTSSRGRKNKDISFNV
ncbi:MAG: endopeptidase La [Bdellovibrionales bacterium]|nr:endopeptidase La [Bdellovibrionales bacterium]